MPILRCFICEHCLRCAPSEAKCPSGICMRSMWDAVLEPMMENSQACKLHVTETCCYRDVLLQVSSCALTQILSHVQPCNRVTEQVGFNLILLSAEKQERSSSAFIGRLTDDQAHGFFCPVIDVSCALLPWACEQEVPGCHLNTEKLILESQFILPPS